MRTTITQATEKLLASGYQLTVADYDFSKRSAMYNITNIETGETTIVTVAELKSILKG